MRSVSTDYSQNLQQKVSFAYIFVFDCQFESRMLPFDVWPSFPVTTWTILSCRFWQDNRTHDSTFSDCNFFRTFSMVFNCHSLFNEAAYLAALRQLRSPFAIREANSKQSKTKIYEKNHLLLRISAVIGRYGPHLMIVMIFVTQNNFSSSSSSSFI